MYEYKTVLVEGWPDAILNAEIVAGWELVGITEGGYDREGKRHPLAVTMWFKRKREVP